MSAENPHAHIYQSLFANLAIAIGKGIVAAITGSGALLAETIHSFADCGNQLLLLVGVRRARQPPDRKHPLGYGRALYFWSFIVALLLFTGGGVASVYEGLHKLNHPEAMESPALAVGILLFSLALEGWSTVGNIRDINKRKGKLGLFRYLQESKDADLIVIFGENSAASLGLIVALISVLGAWATGNPLFDSVGTLLIGAVLIGVAIFLAIEVKSLLVGESADPQVEEAIQQVMPRHPEFVRTLELITVQQGQGEVIVALKAEFKPDIPTGDLCDAINRFEADLRATCPEARWVFVEPDRS